MIKYILAYSFFFISYCLYAQQNTHKVTRGDFEFNIKFTRDYYRFAISTVEIYKKTDNTKIQTIEINENDGALWENIDWEKALVMEDENFDGFLDIRIIRTTTGKGENVYSHWIFDTISKLFKENKKLEEIWYPYFNSKNKTVQAFAFVGCCGEYEALYRFSNDTLTLLKEVHKWWGDNENNQIVSKEQKNGRFELDVRLIKNKLKFEMKGVFDGRFYNINTIDVMIKNDTCSLKNLNLKFDFRDFDNNFEVIDINGDNFLDFSITSIIENKEVYQQWIYNSFEKTFRQK